MLSAARIIEIVNSRLNSTRDKVVVYWHCMEGSDRASFAKEIEDARGERPVVPLVPRMAMQFVNANALQSDLAALLDASRAEIARCPTIGAAPNGHLAILLLMREEMSVAQTSSPAILPDWFPIYAGQSVQIRFEDLARSAELPLSAPETQIHLLPRRLYDLDVAMVQRLRAVHAATPHDVSAFFADIRYEPRDSKAPKESSRSGAQKDGAAPGDTAEKADVFLEGAEEVLRRIPNPDDYRPSVRDARTLVPRLQALVAKTSPDQMSARAKLLAGALRVEPTPGETCESLVALLGRPMQLETAPAIRFGRSLLWSTYAAMQFVTAAKHSDAYRAFRIVLASSTARDLAVTLDDITDAIRRAH